MVAAERPGDGLGLTVEGNAVDVLGALRHGTHGIGRVVVHALEFLRESLVGLNPIWFTHNDYQRLKRAERTAAVRSTLSPMKVHCSGSLVLMLPRR